MEWGLLLYDHQIRVILLHVDASMFRTYRTSYNLLSITEIKLTQTVLMLTFTDQIEHTM